MGRADIESKAYMSDPAHFADLVNYYVFGGEEVVDPGSLTPLDTAEIAIPYGDKARSPVQKYRDVIKSWSTMMDGEAVYIILGAENQTDVHYAMPVKSALYDIINYAGQVSEAGKSYRANSHNGTKSQSESEANSESEAAVRLAGAEFLSGFRKEDKLIAVVTLVVYFGSAKWDGPMTIHEMLSTQNPQILSLVQNYRIHLVSPAAIADEDFDKFRTDLGSVLQYIKYSNDKEKLDEVVHSVDRFRRMDPDSAGLINAVTGSNLKIVENEEGKIDMCVAIDEMRKESRDEGMIEGRREGKIEGHREGKIEGKIEGALETLAHLVRKGRLSLYDAAMEANLTLDEFRLKMEEIK